MGNLMIGTVYPPFLYSGGYNILRVMCGTEQVWPANDITLYVQIIDETGRVLVEKTKCTLHPSGVIDGLPSSIGTGVFTDNIVLAPTMRFFVDMECKEINITQPEGTNYIYGVNTDNTGRAYVRKKVFGEEDYEATIVWVLRYTKSYQPISIKVSQMASPRDSRSFTLDLNVGETPAASNYYTTSWNGTDLIIYVNPIVSGDTYSSFDSNVDSAIKCSYDSTNKLFKIVIPRTAFEEGHKQNNTVTIAYKPGSDGSIKFTFKEDLYFKSGTRWGWVYTEHCSINKNGYLSLEHSEAPLRARKQGDYVYVDFGYVEGYSMTYSISQMPAGATRSGDSWVIPVSAFDTYYPTISVSRVGYQM